MTRCAAGFLSPFIRFPELRTFDPVVQRLSVLSPASLLSRVRCRKCASFQLDPDPISTQEIVREMRALPELPHVIVINCLFPK